MTHQMKLQPAPFAAIQAGTKTIESRLFDEKRQHVQPGDDIVFYNAINLDKTITVQVIELLRYPTFSLLFADFKPSVFGGESIQVLENQIYSFYSKEEEAEYGVVGIRIKAS